MNGSLVQTVLVPLDIHPVLVDIGASGGVPAIWKSLASEAIYIGFDPDQRDLQEITNGQFFKGIIVNKAVSSNMQNPTVTFYLTKSPHCSSTLKPDIPALSDYFFTDLFTVTGQVTVPATTLDAVIEQQGLVGVDWVKVDSQGTDLRLLTSLQEEKLSRLLAIDVEPGLIDAYEGEDLFVDTHKHLVEHGFWLSNLNVKGSPRIKQTTLQEIVPRFRGVTCNWLQKSVRTSPGWCEARYFRTPESLQSQDGKRAYVLLWVFALIDQQFGFALDIALEYKQIFGEDKVAHILMHEPMVLIKKKFPLSLVKRILHAILRRIDTL